MSSSFEVTLFLFNFLISEDEDTDEITFEVDSTSTGLVQSSLAIGRG